LAAIYSADNAARKVFMLKLVTCAAIVALPVVAFAASPLPAPGPVYVATAVPGLTIASHQNLTIEAIDIAVSVNSVSYTYRFGNTGTAELTLAASISLPSLKQSMNEDETYRISTANAENPIGLTIKADEKPVNAKIIARALALDVERTAEIKAVNLPLIPFGPEIDKALKGLAPDVLTRLTQLGLISPPDEQNSPRNADWTLDVTYAWDQVLPPDKTTTISMTFLPMSGSFELNAKTADILDDLKADACLTDQAIKTLKAKVAKSPTPVTEIVISIVNPTHWLPTPSPTITVQKPKPDTIVALCAINVKTYPSQVTAKVADDEDSEELRVVLIGAAAQ
jgi:Domain of unknown function (DUF4424)